MNKFMRFLIVFIVALVLVLASAWKNDLQGMPVEEAVFMASPPPVTPTQAAGDSGPRQKYIFVEFFAGL